MANTTTLVNDGNISVSDDHIGLDLDAQDYYDSIDTATNRTSLTNITLDYCQVDGDSGRSVVTTLCVTGACQDYPGVRPLHRHRVRPLLRVRSGGRLLRVQMLQGDHVSLRVHLRLHRGLPHLCGGEGKQSCPSHFSLSAYIISVSVNNHQTSPIHAMPGAARVE